MSKKSKWSEYSSIEKVQEFINSNNISSKIDFKKKININLYILELD